MDPIVVIGGLISLLLVVGGFYLADYIVRKRNARHP